MAIVSLTEILDALLMTVVLGYIFKDMFQSPAKEDYDPLTAAKSRFDLSNLKFAMLVTAPAIILHEAGHKFVAMAFGLSATFHAAYTWLIVGIVLKLIGSPFIFFVPAYVSYPAMATPGQEALIAFAGPGINLLLWVGAWAYLKFSQGLSRKTIYALSLTSKINMFLFFFNMIPFGPFDGAHVFGSLFTMMQGL